MPVLKKTELVFIHSDLLINAFSSKELLLN